jgi:hypothetical protein
MPTIYISRAWLILLFCMQTGINVKAGPESDTLYIRKYPDQLHLSTGLQTNNSAIVLTDLNNRYSLFLSPRRSLQQFLKGEYRGMAFKYAISPGYLNPDVSAVTGRNTRKSFGYSFGLGPIGIDLNYERSKGYFLENTVDFDPSWRPGQPYIQLNNLQSVLYGIQLSYNVRKKFSEAAVGSCRERQLKPGYSFIPGLGINHIVYSNTVAGTDSFTGQTRYLDCNARLFMAGSLPLFHRKLQLSAIAGPIIGVSFVQDRTYDLRQFSEQEANTSVLSLGMMYKIGLSFNTHRWFMGINIFSEQYGSKLSGSQLFKSFYGVELYTGVRFPAPKFLKSATDWTFKQADKLNPLKPGRSK